MKSTKNVIAMSVVGLFMAGTVHAELVSETALQKRLDEKQDTLTVAQQAAVDSGITSEKVGTYDGYAADIATALAKQDKISVTGGTAKLGSVVSAVTLNTDGKTVNVTMQDLGDYATNDDIGDLDQKITAADTIARAAVVANAPIAPGTHTKITYDSKGLVVEGTDLTPADIPELTSSKITDLGLTIANATSGKQEQVAIVGGAAMTGKVVSAVTLNGDGKTIEVSMQDISNLATKSEVSAVDGKLNTVETTANAAKATADKAVVANDTITGGTHTKITYDEKGLVTAGADLTVDDIPNLPTSKITDLNTVVSSQTAGKQDKLTNTNVKDSGTGNMVTSVTASDGTVTVSKSNVQIPIGGANSTDYAPIWVD